MKYSAFAILVFFLCTGYAQNYQDSIILLNGKVIRGNVLEHKDGMLTVSTLRKEGKPSRELNLETYRIFSYHQKGEETVIYKKDATPENFLTENQSRKFALGGYDANNFYSSQSAFYTSAALAFGFCVIDTYMTESSRDAIGNPDLNVGFFGRSPSIWPIASILVLPISFGLPSTKVRTKNLKNGVRGDEFYYAGFNDMAKKKRTMSSLKGSFVGLVLGYASYGVFHTNDF